MQILIRFPDQETERRALGKLIPRFSGKSWVSGETAVPAIALSFLADEGIQFTVIGPAPYEYVTPLRDPRPVHRAACQTETARSLSMACDHR